MSAQSEVFPQPVYLDASGCLSLVRDYWLIKYVYWNIGLDKIRFIEVQTWQVTTKKQVPYQVQPHKQNAQQED